MQPKKEEPRTEEGKAIGKGRARNHMYITSIAFKERPRKAIEERRSRNRPEQRILSHGGTEIMQNLMYVSRIPRYNKRLG